MIFACGVALLGLSIKGLTINPLLSGLCATISIHHIQEMIHGEDKLSQQGIDAGYNYIKKQKK